jgi:hypothetical protein
VRVEGIILVHPTGLSRLKVEVDIDADLQYTTYRYNCYSRARGVHWRLCKLPVPGRRVPTAHAHYSANEAYHLPYREVELNEAIDWFLDQVQPPRDHPYR